MGPIYKETKYLTNELIDRKPLLIGLMSFKGLSRLIDDTRVIEITHKQGEGTSISEAIGRCFDTGNFKLGGNSRWLYACHTWLFLSPIG